MTNKVFKLELFVDDKNEKRVNVTVEASEEEVANMFDTAVGCHKDLISPILAGMCPHISVSTAIRFLDIIIKKDPISVCKEIGAYERLSNYSKSAAKARCKKHRECKKN